MLNFARPCRDTETEADLSVVTEARLTQDSKIRVNMKSNHDVIITTTLEGRYSCDAHLQERKLRLGEGKSSSKITQLESYALGSAGLRCLHPDDPEFTPLNAFRLSLT